MNYSDFIEVILFLGADIFASFYFLFFSLISFHSVISLLKIFFRKGTNNFMEKRNKTLNLTLTSGWTAAIVILLVIYAVEVAKGQRSSLYFITFTLITLSPNILAWLLYFYIKESENLKYAVLLGYFTMYTFVLLTGRSALCFTYIFPLLCLLMVYHDT